MFLHSNLFVNKLLSSIWNGNDHCMVMCLGYVNIISNQPKSFYNALLFLVGFEFKSSKKCTYQITDRVPGVVC